jgi:hypothetical protein
VIYRDGDTKCPHPYKKVILPVANRGSRSNPGAR